jgi:hypothetical protein
VWVGLNGHLPLPNLAHALIQIEAIQIGAATRTGVVGARAHTSDSSHESLHHAVARLGCWQYKHLLAHDGSLKS